MSCNDNCNPINLPVIQGPQGLKGDKGDQGDKGDKGDTGPAGPAGPGELLLGKTLYVSKLGNDTTAVPYDIANHYLTITAAQNDAVAGDTIVVHPGTYNEASLYKNGVNYHFLNGAILGLTGSEVAFYVNDVSGRCDVTGDLEVVSYGVSPNVTVLYTVSTTCIVSFECKNINIAGTAFNLQQGTVNVDVKEYASATNVVLLVRSGTNKANLVFNARKLIWTGSNESLSYTTGAIFVGYNHAGKAIITVDEITNGGNGGTNMITVAGVLGSTYIKCPKVINNFTGFATVGLLITNQIPYFRFEGNIYSNNTGSLAGGVCSAIQQGSSYPHYVEIIGDIYVDENYAMYVNNGPARIKYSGNMYGRNTGTGLTINGSWPGPFPNGGAVPVTFLVYIGLEVSTGVVHSYVWFKDATLNQFASGSVCIYKRQAYMPGETSQYLQLDNVDFWVDGESFCINGDTTAVQNKIQVNACNSNVIVSPTITQVGENILINSSLVSYDNPYSNT